MKTASYDDVKKAIKQGRLRVLFNGVVQGRRGVKNPYWFDKKLEKIKSSTHDAPPYLRVSFKLDDGSTHRILVHRLVWYCYRGPIAKGLQLNHINGKKLDNRIDNLELVTPSENLKHAAEQRLNRGCSKLTDKQVRALRLELKDGLLVKVAARRYGVSVQSVRQLKNGKSYKHVI